VLRGGLDVPDELRLPRRLRLDVDRATDEQILRGISRIVAAYVPALEFARDLRGFHGTPFDVFLDRNGWPRQLHAGQSQRRHTRRLRARLARRNDPVVVGPRGLRRFALHDQAFQFGAEELRGLRIFLRERSSGAGGGGVGNCVACHPVPTFTDFAAHNTGVTQREYDAVHGEGSFAALPIPHLETRNADPDRYLPATTAHPHAAEPFRRVVAAEAPGHVDLGLWNLFANPDFGDARYQRRLARTVCGALGAEACRAAGGDPATLLDGAVALFKTPGLRDLGHSGPYFHDGSADTLEDVVQFYVDVSAQARAGTLRNAAPELRDMDLGPEDVAPLAAFLRALNEDYE
jgi:cytochrome c peroxidase